MYPELSTVVIDGPHSTPYGGEYTRIVVLDGDGQEIGWMSIDRSDHNYAPQDAHPDADHLGWPADYPWAYVFNNNEVPWAAPSYEGAVEAALFEHAVRLSSHWYDAS